MHESLSLAVTPKRVALFVSGKESSATSIIEYQRTLEGKQNAPYEIAVIFTDRDGSCAFDIGRKYSIPIELHDVGRFCRSMGKRVSDLSARPAYFGAVLHSLDAYDIDIICLAGYGLIITKPLLGRYHNRILNIHPADLSVRDGNGRAVYVGNNAVEDAILSGTKELRSTVHIVTEDLDQGSPILISRPVTVELPEGIPVVNPDEPMSANLPRQISDKYREMLRAEELEVYPLALEFLSRDMIGIDNDGTVYADDETIDMIISKGFKISGMHMRSAAMQAHSP